MPVPETGDCWVVLRPEGAGAAKGGTYRLGVVVKGTAWKPTGTAAVEGDPPVAAFPFDAVEGSTLTGTVAGTAEEPSMELPDGSALPLEAILKHGTARLAPVVLTGGTGTYRLLATPGAGPVEVRLSLRPPKRRALPEEEP